MNNALKRMGCFALVLVLVFMLFAQPLAPKADASALAISASAAASILQFAALCGITFMTYKAAEAGVNAFVEANPDIMSGEMKYWLGQVPDPNTPDGDPNKWALSAGTVAMANTLINKLRSFFGGKEELEVPEENISTVFNYPIVDRIDEINISDSALMNYCHISHKERLYVSSPEPDKIDFIINGVPYYFYFKTSASSINAIVRRGTSASGIVNTSNYSLGDFDIKLGFYRYPYGGNVIRPFIVKRYVDSNGNVRFERKLSTFDIPLQEGMMLPGVTKVPYNNKSAYTIPSIKQGITNSVNLSPEPIVIDKTQVIEAIETENDEELKDALFQDKIINSIPGFRDILEDIRDSLPPPEVDFVPPELNGGELSEKFPFCVPFDLFRLVKALNAPAVAPRWEIPISFPAVNYEDSIVLDLGQFEILAIPIRWGLTLVYLLGLIMVSRKMIKG